MDKNQNINIYQPQKKKKGFLGGILIGLLVGLFVSAFVVIIVLGFYQLKDRFLDNTASVVETEDVSEDAVLNVETISKLETLEKAISLFSIYEVEPEVLADGVYQGLIDSLDDPYSDYYSEEELDAFNEEASGTYYGVGAYIGYNKEYDFPEFTKIMEGTPAEQAGVLPGDIIFSVDGVNCYEMETADVVPLVKGEQGTYVTITVYRENLDEYVDIDIMRDKIETPLVVHEMMDNNIGYIEIMQFEETTLQQFEDAKTELEEAGMASLIIDLRGNPGGSLDVVNNIARLLLPEGEIVYTINKLDERTDYMCDGKNEIQIPLVVLTNEQSASASEILAGAIKDYGIGTLVGETTFGKGIVQRIIDLGDGTAVKLTIAEYYTPAGINIHGIGIDPDIEVEFDSDLFLEQGIDNQLEKAVEVLTQQ